ncbi:CoA transferase [Microbulbifer flavimaris]|uniref:CoA transferase n=1 Tax=Microbulbifer flavimaris TaxID=1781068 RepID=A0ABX4I1N7_9GAMM|nr:MULTISPECIES: CaiB/BaiF CoA-transferase family protein [Microbulbifer]KUJ83685.1 carnitine dehydratase [Microbulbifer sp. ZGT114]PCO05852.1 CoA transferase [Microbulbifer flavimaris]
MLPDSGPLAGLKVLDFSTLLPGPYATLLLADMGADVLRIESPQRPDMLRALPPYFGEGKDQVSAAHAGINRNKRSLALNLKDHRAGDIVRRLLAEYDIVIEQFRPGVMEKLGLSYETLRQTREDLIYCSITGYGQSGPMTQRAGHDINYLALSGLASYSGRADSGPSLSGTQVADIAGGSHHAVMAILAAVYRRQNSGKGSHIDISMTDCAFALNAISGTNALAGGDLPGLEHELLNGGSYYDYYRTADGRYLSVGSLEPQFATRFFEGIGEPQWVERLMADEPPGILKADIAGVIANRPLEQWVQVFADIDACVEPVLDFQEASDSALVRERKMICHTDLGHGETVEQINTPFCFDGHKPDYHAPGAPLGQHSRDVLLGLGLEDTEIDSLLADQVIA